MYAATMQRGYKAPASTPAPSARLAPAATTSSRACVGFPSKSAGNKGLARTLAASFAPRKSRAHKEVGKCGPVVAGAASKSKSERKSDKKSEKQAEKPTPVIPEIKKSFLPVAKVVDEKTGLELECVVHQTFEVKDKGEICLLEPLDIPIQVRTEHVTLENYNHRKQNGPTMKSGTYNCS